MKTTDCVYIACGEHLKKNRDLGLNVKKEELKQYIYLKRETELCEQKLDALKDKDEEYRELYELIENNRLRCISLLMKLQSFIYSIDDSLLRQIFEYRYVNGLRWSGVSARLGGYISEDNVRIMHDRYLKSLEKN